MMRRITVFALALSILLISSVSVCAALPTSEEQSETETAELTRLEVCRQMIQLFDLKADGDISPLLRYNDWSSLSGEDRYIAAAVVKSGVFAPKTASFTPHKTMSPEDFDALLYGMDMFSIHSPDYYRCVGVLASVKRKNATIRDNYNKEYELQEGIPVIFENEILTSFSTLKTGGDFEAIYDKDGNAVIAWQKRPSAPSVLYMLRGSLYLYDSIGERLIFNRLSTLKNNTWVKSKDVYAEAAVTDETIMILGGKRVRLSEANTSLIDKAASVIIGEKDGQPFVIYVKFD